MGNEQLLSSGQGYMTSETGAGPGFGVESEGHNTGIGATGAGTGTSGYRHGTGEFHTGLFVPLTKLYSA